MVSELVIGSGEQGILCMYTRNTCFTRLACFCDLSGLKNHNFLPSNQIGPAKGFLDCLETFTKILFPINQLLHAIFGLRGVFLASNILHDLGGQKQSCTYYNTKNFEQIRWYEIFYRVYGLAVMLSSPRFGYHVSY